MGIRETTYCSECLRPQDERIAELEQQVEAQASRIATLEQLVTDAMEDDTDFMTEWDAAAQAYFDAQEGE